MNTISKPGMAQAMKMSTYLWAAAFVAGNVILPQMLHAVNMGGRIFLPIMLFTVIAAARYGTVCAVVTALLSPLLSMMITGMPSGEMMVSLMVRSLILAAAIGTWKQYRGEFSILSIIALTAGAHLVGFMVDGITFFGFSAAWTSLAMSWPGILIQMIAFWAVTRKLTH